MKEIGLQSLTRWPKLESLREKLNGRAKAKPGFRFYSLYDKVYRKDVLEAAYAQCRANDGAPGVDGQTFEDIEGYGVERYLAELAEELKTLRYRPQAVRRKLIPKENQPGKFRPLGIPTLRDRIVQQAVKLLLEPIFEADLPENAYGYRPGRSAADAIEDVDRGLRHKQVCVVDADLSKYFDTIPHDPLMRSVERRVSDRKVLWLIRHWLKAPVQEDVNGATVISGGWSTKRGTPQGGVISPLLANLYFRRFLRAWKRFGYGRKFASRIVNYADDFVILCQHSAHAARAAARQLLDRLGLELNEKKTRVVRAWQTSFDFLGYTFGVVHIRNGKECLGPRPSEKNLQRYRAAIRQETGRSKLGCTMEQVAQALNAKTAGFWGYFRWGATHKARHVLDTYLGLRMRRWAGQKWPHPRGKRQQRRNASSPGGRQTRIAQALKLIRRSKDLGWWCGEALFRHAARYAQ